MGDHKRLFAPTWRIACRRYLPALAILVLWVSIAEPALALDEDPVGISSPIAEDVLIEQLQSRGLVPPSGSDLTLEDYIYRGAGQSRFDGTVGVWLGSDGNMIPSREWQDRHEDHCKNRARSPREAAQLLSFEMMRVREKADGKDRSQYWVYGQLIDTATNLIQKKHEGETSVMQADNTSAGVMNNPDRDGLPPAMDAAWDGLNLNIGAPVGPCGDIRVEHVSGNAVGDEVEFLAGYTDTHAPSLTYAWDFGDGTTSEDAGRRPRHVYAKKGTYTVTVRVEGKVDGKQVEPGIGSVSVVIDDNQLKLVFSSRIEQNFPNGRFLQEFQSTVPLAMGANSVFEGQAALRSVQMDNSYQDQMMASTGCTLSPRKGVLKVSATLPQSLKQSADGIKVSMTVPMDPARSMFEAVPGVDVTCPPPAGGLGMAVLKGMGAHWWMSFQMLHIDDLQAQSEFGFADWQPSNDPGVIARKTYRREKRIDGDQTLREVTTMEIRGSATSATP
ncbi:PKD domain-containing protein [Lysobacter sp. A289]